jgi:hypothetical protein
LRPSGKSTFLPHEPVLADGRRYLTLDKFDVGGVLNLRGLARDVQRPPTTVTRHLGLLGAMCLIHRLPPFLGNRSKRLIKSPRILKVRGRSDLFFRLTLIKRSLTAIAVLITCRWGSSAMLAGQIVASAIGNSINSVYTGKFIGTYLLINRLLRGEPLFDFVRLGRNRLVSISGQ